MIQPKKFSFRSYVRTEDGLVQGEIEKLNCCEAHIGQGRDFHVVYCSLGGLIVLAIAILFLFKRK